MHPIVAGTAGHIDHGKTALVHALTGIDTDRLKEEKERGITTDLGFAYLDYPDGVRLAFIDVPGHERFIHNMLAGVCGIDVVLLVIAADESIMPQTREHADICRLLGVRRAVIALTKSDLVEPETIEVVRMEVRDFAAASGFEAPEIVSVSARTGRGLEDLKAAIRRAADAAPARVPGRPLRLPVDRVFSARGFGTVVTGTLWAGRLRTDQEVEVSPGGERVRVRGLQVHHRAVEEAVGGQRVAVNLHGAAAESLARGAVLLEPGLGGGERFLVCRLELATPFSRSSRSGNQALYHGTLETAVRWSWLEEPAVEGGATRGLALLCCRTPVPAIRGDRFVIRRRSPSATLGGGQVLDALAGRRPRAELLEHARRLDGAGERESLVEDLRWGREPVQAARALWLRSGLERSALETALRLAEAGQQIVALGGELWIESGRLRGLESRALEMLRSFHEAERLHAGMPLEELKVRLLGEGARALAEPLLARLQHSGRVRVERDRVALAEHHVRLEGFESRFAEALESAYCAAGLNPPEMEDALRACGAPAQVAERLLHLLVRNGRLVRIKSGRLYHASAMEALLEALQRERHLSPRIDVGRFKELTGTSRKNAIPLLEHLDATRVTRREGNERIIL